MTQQVLLLLLAITVCSASHSTKNMLQRQGKMTSADSQILSSTDPESIDAVVFESAVQAVKRYQAIQQEQQNRMYSPPAVQQERLQANMYSSPAVQQERLQANMYSSPAVQQERLQANMYSSRAVQQERLQANMYSSPAVQQERLQANMYSSPAVQQERLQSSHQYNAAAAAQQGPSAYSFLYGTKLEDGGTNYRSESGDGRGKVIGSYTLSVPNGGYRKVEYVADEGGFRAIVNTNEFGTKAESPDNVQLFSSAK